MHLNTELNHNDNNIVVCMNEIKMGMFAKNALFSGIIVLILNLITSFSDNSAELDHSVKIQGRSLMMIHTLNIR